jgi:PncC family amidohydrolase
MKISFEGALVEILTEKKLKISTAESCTGGLLSKLITDVPGSSSVFMGGVIAYDNGVKKRLLGVPGSILKSYGAVSFECALAMAEGLNVAVPSDLRVSITGVAGPAGGSEEKPVGTVFIALAVNGRETSVFRCLFRGDRDMIRSSAAKLAIEFILEELSPGKMEISGKNNVVEKRVYNR